MNLKAAVLGGGSWGTTVASLIARNAPVTIWARDEETVVEINESHSNDKYLPGAMLNPKLVATHSIEEAVAACDVLVMGVPSQHFRGVLENAIPFLRPWVPVISLTKGLEPGSLKRMTQVNVLLHVALIAPLTFRVMPHFMDYVENAQLAAVANGSENPPPVGPYLPDISEFGQGYDELDDTFS